MLSGGGISDLGAALLLLAILAGDSLVLAYLAMWLGEAGEAAMLAARAAPQRFRRAA